MRKEDGDVSLIEVRDLVHHYSFETPEGRGALAGISLDIDEGEYVALVGANGSGKTTLAFHLNALLLPSSGLVRIEGLDTREHRDIPMIRRSVGVVFQKPEDQIVALTVEEDAAFGPENLRLPREEIVRRVSESLRRVGLAGLETRSPHKLSAGQKQRLSIAGVLALRPKVIVFDEPTSMLDPGGRRETLELMRELHLSGATIIHITQRMDEAAEAPRMIALDGGRVALDAPPRAAFSSRHEVLNALGRPPALELARGLAARGAGDLGAPLTYRELGSALAPRLAARRRGSPIEAHGPRDPRAAPLMRGSSDDHDRLRAEEARRSGPLISVSALSHSYERPTDNPASIPSRSLDGVTIEVNRGDFLAVVGPTGSGKSTLLQHLNGLFRPQEGEVRVDGIDVAAGGSSAVALRRRVGLVFQRPEEQIFERYVGDEVAFGPRMAGVRGRDLSERVRWAMELVGLPFQGFKDRMSFALSGGEQRKIGIASILALRPSVLLLDEPTAGLDPPARRHLMALLSRLRGEGTTIVASTHDMDLAAEMAGTVVVLSRGRVVSCGAPDEVFARREELRSIGLAPPDSFELWDELAARGMTDDGTAAAAPGELLEALVRLLGLAPARAGAEG